MRLLRNIALCLLPASAWAAPVGQPELQAIVNIMGSPFGIGLGLLVAVGGIWSLFVSQAVGRGIILVILGVLITSFPSFYNFVRNDFYGVPKSLGGSGNAGDFNQYIR